MPTRKISRPPAYALAAAFALSLAPAEICAKPATGKFPIGIYRAEPKHLAALKQAGFTAAQSYQTDPAFLSGLAREAKQQGFELLIRPEEVAASTFSTEAADWPVLAWYVYDEPDVHNLPAAELAARIKTVKTSLPGQPAAFVIGEGGPALAYGHLADALMVDWYPVPHLPLESVGFQAELALKGMRLACLSKKTECPQKPLWAVIQAFDWRDYPQRDDKKPRIGRFPTRQELRFMTYYAIIKGANGIFYYELNKHGTGLTLFDFPENWESLKSVTAELGGLRKTLEEGTPAACRCDKPLECRAWEFNGEGLAFFANPSKVTAVLPETVNSKPLRIISAPAQARTRGLEPYGIAIAKY